MSEISKRLLQGTSKAAGAPAALVLEDGAVFRGTSCAAAGEVFGEICFNTSLEGYLEVITDPSYAGQIVTMTYPQIGNYGVNVDDVQADEPALRGLVVRDLCATPSNWRSAQGLPDYLLSRYPHQISGGEGQRLVICRALLLEPEVLLLDEPTSMLDVSVQASIMNLLRELQERLGLTYLYITHDIELLGWISHTIGVMQRGRLVEVGSREQVMEAPVHPYTRELLYSYTHWEGGGET